MLRLLDDPTLRVAMGRCGRALVEREYALSRMLDRLEAVYEEVGRR
jgi:glycosyltransferase involved in cell wall biosynthesis